jgi:hypothetical protein
MASCTTCKLTQTTMVSITTNKGRAQVIHFIGMMLMNPTGQEATLKIMWLRQTPTRVDTFMLLSRDKHRVLPPRQHMALHIWQNIML